jgi:hypothetical protein
VSEEDGSITPVPPPQIEIPEVHGTVTKSQSTWNGVADVHRTPQHLPRALPVSEGILMLTDTKIMRKMTNCAATVTEFIFYILWFAIQMNATVLWSVIPYSTVDSYQHFRKMHCFHKVELVYPKHLHLCKKIQCFTSQNTIILTLTAVSISDLVSLYIWHAHHAEVSLARSRDLISIGFGTRTAGIRNRLLIMYTDCTWTWENNYVHRFFST